MCFNQDLYINFPALIWANEYWEVTIHVTVMLRSVFWQHFEYISLGLLNI